MESTQQRQEIAWIWPIAAVSDCDWHWGGRNVSEDQSASE